MQRSALHKMFDFNVMKFADGNMGAVNGIAPDGSLVKTNEQVQEVWTGTTFGLAEDFAAKAEQTRNQLCRHFFLDSYEGSVIISLG
jgi:uncharacterized protein (DUF608 family)